MNLWNTIVAIGHFFGPGCLIEILIMLVLLAALVMSGGN